MTRCIGLASALTVLMLAACDKSSTTAPSKYGASTTPQPVQSVEQQVAPWVDQQILAPEGMSLANEKLRYLAGRADLNHDGRDEYLVLMQDGYFCGTGGCTAVMFDDMGQTIARMTVTSLPIILLSSESGGWQDYLVWSDGAFHIMRYDGETYPTNPSVEPVFDITQDLQAAKAKVMESELYQQDGSGLHWIEPQQIWSPAGVYQFEFQHHGDGQYQAKVDLATDSVSIAPLK